jgi:hypothetical protein
VALHQGSCAGLETLCAHRKSGGSMTPRQSSFQDHLLGEDTLTVCRPFMSRSRSRQPTLSICNLSATSQPPCRTACDETQSTRKGFQRLDQPGRRIARREAASIPDQAPSNVSIDTGEPATRADRSHCSATRSQFGGVSRFSAGVTCRDHRLQWYTRTPTGRRSGVVKMQIGHSDLLFLSLMSSGPIPH